MIVALYIAAGALLGFMCAWFARHPEDVRADDETGKERRSNTPDREREEHEQFMKEQQRQFDMLMKYTGEKQKG